MSGQSSNWRELLRSQQEELGLGNGNAGQRASLNNNNDRDEMNEIQLSEDIDRILKKPLPSANTVNMASTMKSSTSAPNSSRTMGSSNNSNHNNNNNSSANADSPSVRTSHNFSQDDRSSFIPNSGIMNNRASASRPNSSSSSSTTGRAASTGRVRSTPTTGSGNSSNNGNSGIARSLASTSANVKRLSAGNGAGGAASSSSAYFQRDNNDNNNNDEHNDDANDFQNNSNNNTRRGSSGTGGNSARGGGVNNNGNMNATSEASLVLAGAPEANNKYQQAKIKLLTQQVQEGIELRRHLNEQVSDLQKQLKLEKDETRVMKKRISLLETESRKTATSGNKQGSGGDAATPINTDNTEALLTQEVATLQKDLQAMERLVKQAETTNKTKDAQLKRAAETVSRLKAQATEMQQQSKSNMGVDNDDRSRAETAEQRIKLLERQRTDLIAAFRKQLKLIDLLKRQKVHLEAMQLLSFTEEEFLKTLDWTV